MYNCIYYFIFSIILRFLLCFWIVLGHSSIVKMQGIKVMTRNFHVPTFFLLAFYFYYPLLSNRKLQKIVSRFQRLLIPYLLWPIILIVLHNASIQTFPVTYFSNKIPLKYLFLQFLIGTPYFRVFWFQFNLIFISLCLTIISFIFKKYVLEIYYLFVVIALHLNITQINFNFFISFHRNFGGNTGSLIELVPSAIIGCYFSSINLLMKIKQLPRYFQFILIYFLYLLFKYDIFINLKGFRYPDVFLNSLVSIILFILFGSLDFEKSKINNANIIIIYITKYTGGIYYLHMMVKDCLINKFVFFKNATYLSATVLYIFCYFICFIGHKVFNNNFLKYLFI